MKLWWYAENNQRLGPVDKSEILRRYSEGLIRPDDLVWEEGMPDWVPAQSALGPAPTPTGSPSAAIPQASTKKIDVLRYFSLGWEKLWQQPAYLLGGVFIFLLLSQIVQFPANIGSILGVIANSTPMSDNTRGMVAVLNIALKLLTLLLTIALIPPLKAGMYQYILRIIRGKGQPDIKDLFAGFKAGYAPLVTAGFVMSVFWCIGCCAFVIPMVYLFVAYLFTLPLIIDRKMGFWEAMETSRIRVTECWWEMFLFLILSLLILLAGYLACCVGVIIAAPWVYTSLMYAYEDLFPAAPGDNDSSVKENPLPASGES